MTGEDLGVDLHTSRFVGFGLRVVILISRAAVSRLPNSARHFASRSAVQARGLTFRLILGRTTGSSGL
jgi:hypothetical protein